jgi:monoamine oxidase
VIVSNGYFRDGVHVPMLPGKPGPNHTLRHGTGPSVAVPPPLTEGALLTEGTAFTEGAALTEGSRRNVTIIGAGIAGLVAAYELERLGYDVEVLEASRRVGGRIYTHRFGAGAEAPFAELGAMRIPTHHEHTMRYVSLLGLGGDVQRFRSVLSDENAYVGTSTGYLRLRDVSRALVQDLGRDLPDQRYRDETLQFGAWLSVVVDAIAPVGQRAILRRNLRHLLDLVDAIEVEPYRDPSGSQIDLQALFAAHPHLQEACGGELSSFLDDILTESGRDLVRIQGGMGRLVDRLVRRIRGPVLCRREVVGLDVRVDGVGIQVREGGRLVALQRDLVVCTVPFSVVRRMRLTGFSAEKLEVIRQVRYVPATKVAFHCREPFWEQAGITGGASSSGGRVRQTYYPPVEGDPALGAVLLASYAIGDDAEALDRMASAARYAAVLADLGQMHPELLRPGMVLDAASQSWGLYPWSSGGCSVRWGKEGAAGEAERARAAAAERNLFFAGEHCSSSPAWIDGAIESALAVVAQITDVDPRRRDERTDAEPVDHVVGPSVDPLVRPGGGLPVEHAAEARVGG